MNSFEQDRNHSPNNQPNEYERWKGNVGGPPPKKKTLTAFDKGVIIFLGSVFAITLLYLVVSGSSSFGSSFGGNYIAVIDIEGSISSSSGGGLLSSGSSYDHSWTINTINDLVDDHSNTGLLLRLNTPGGGVYESDDIYYAIKNYQEETGRPVYAYMGSMAASGGYYVSAPCDMIYANRNCWTGSIGVTIGTLYDYTGLMEKYGIKAETITSGKNKAMGSGAEPMTEEQRALFQGLVDEAYNQFVDIVAKGRNLSVEEVKKVADGRILTAQQALDAKLIDGICTEDEVLNIMQSDEDLESSDFNYMSPPENTSLFGSLSGMISGKNDSSDLKQLMNIVANGNTFTISYKANIDK